MELIHLHVSESRTFEVEIYKQTVSGTPLVNLILLLVLKRLTFEKKFKKTIFGSLTVNPMFA